MHDYVCLLCVWTSLVFACLCLYVFACSVCLFVLSVFVFVPYLWLCYVCVCFVCRVHSFPQGYKTSTVDKPRTLRATVAPSSSASSQSSQNQALQIPKDQELDRGQPRENHQDPSTQKQTSPQPVHPKTIPVLQSRDKTRRDSKTTESDNNSVSNSIKRFSVSMNF